MGSLDARFLEIPEDIVILKIIELSKEASQPWLQTEGFGCKQRYTFPEIPEYMARSAQPAGALRFAPGGTMKELHVARRLRESLVSTGLEIPWREPGLASVSAWGLDIQPLPGLDLDVLPAKTESVAVESSFLG